MVHKEKKLTQTRNVSFTETEIVNYSEKQSNDVRKAKMRFKEVTQDRKLNERRIYLKVEEALYAEIKETPENTEKVKAAKAKELPNFDDYGAFEEVKDEGQQC